MLIEDKNAIILAHQKELSVDVIAIANAFGMKVYTVTFTDDDLSGMIRKDEEEYGIYVNRHHAKTRQRFTIAHEIAHFVLHQPLIGDGIVDDALYRSALSNKVEAQANRLAADILMPWSLLATEINKGNDDIDELAEMFNVSTHAMSIRLGFPYDPK